MKYYFFQKNRLTLITLASLALLAGCDNSDDYSENHPSHQQSSYLEKYRPQLQFTAAKNWQNDPNGMVYFDGEYHLFYQYNPNGNSWGDLSWGHAVSRDLVHWEELPVALPVEKDADGNVTQMYFSGSAVVDFNNSSGFGKADRPAMVAMYTSYYPTDMTLDNGKTIAAGTRAQSIAYSLDKGRTRRSMKIIRSSLYRQRAMRVSLRNFAILKYSGMRRKTNGSWWRSLRLSIKRYFIHRPICVIGTL